MQIDFVEVYEFLLKNDVTEPVTVMKHGKPHAAIIPYEIFEALKGNQQAIATEDLSSDDLDAILNAEIPEENAQFDGELKK